MNLKYNYYYFQSALSPKFCQDVIDYGKEQQSVMAITGDGDRSSDKMSKKDIKNIQKKRKSDIVWMSDKWIYNEIHPFIHEANKKAGWNFEWDWSESCQFTKYGKGQYYGWHTDSFNNPLNTPDDLNSHGKIRKLSVTISLNNPNEYEGGNLEFDYRNHLDWEKNKEKSFETCEQIRPIGSIIVFPSFVWHRVTPVTKGTRYSLVIWNCGKPFR